MLREVPTSQVGIVVTDILASDCTCGSQLSLDAHKLSTDNCAVSCSGDPRLACGGKDNVAIYNLISSSKNNTSSAKQTLSTAAQAKSKATSATTNSKATSTIAPSNKSQTADSKKSDATTLPPSAAPKPVATSTVAAITGSFSGAVLIGAGLFLCFRAQKRKKKAQELYVKAVLDRSEGGDDKDEKGGPVPIITSAEDIHDVNNISSSVLAAPGYHHRRHGSSVNKGDGSDGDNGNAWRGEGDDKKNSSHGYGLGIGIGIAGGIGRALGRHSAAEKHSSKSQSQSQPHLAVVVAPLSAEDDVVPTTPALESGDRYPSIPSGLHARNKSVSTSASSSVHHQHGLSAFSTSTFSSTSSTSTSTPTSTLIPRTSSHTPAEEPGNRSKEKGNKDRDSLYNTLLGEVRSGPAHPRGESSAVQWRSYSSNPNPNYSPNPRPGGNVGTGTGIGTTHKHQISSSGIASPPPSAKLDASLGERAWHRRKLSAKFQPPRSGPPTVPLPPTPAPALPVRSGPGAAGRGKGDCMNGNVNGAMNGNRGVDKNAAVATGLGMGLGVGMGIGMANMGTRKSTSTERYRGIDSGRTAKHFTISDRNNTPNSTLPPLPPRRCPRRSSDTMIFEPEHYDDFGFEHDYDTLQGPSSFHPSKPYCPFTASEIQQPLCSPLFLPSSRYVPTSSSSQPPSQLPPSPSHLPSQPPLTLPSPRTPTSASASINGPSSPGLSMTFANTSTPSLGRYGSLSRRQKQRPRPESFLESPVLGRFAVNNKRAAPKHHTQPNQQYQYRQQQQQQQQQKQTGVKGLRGDIGSGSGNEIDKKEREPTLPVLPPIAPGERFDHKRWRDTVYAPHTPSSTSSTRPGSSDSNEENGRGGRGGGGDRESRDRTPVSASSSTSVGTSILFTEQEFDRRL